jgi:cysteine desulfurase
VAAFELSAAAHAKTAAHINAVASRGIKQPAAKSAAYLDCAAGAPVLPEALRVLAETAAVTGNPSSTHTGGRGKKQILEAARTAILTAAGVPDYTCIFTSGGTEADNLAVLGYARKNSRAGRHIIVSAAEHDAVLNSAKALEAEGFSVTYLAPDKSGAVPVSDLQNALREDTILVSLMAVNNETGASAPIAEYAAAVHNSSRAVLHTDAVQAFCKLPPEGYNAADIITISAHKIGGAAGAGAVALRKSIKLAPLLFGGGQENGLRPGTENVPAIAAFAKSAELRSAAIAENAAHMQTLRDRLLLLLAGIPGFCPTLPENAAASPYILSFSLLGDPSEITTNVLSDKGFYISRSSACKKGKRSHVLTAMNLPVKQTDTALRVSFSPETTAEEAEGFAEAVRSVTAGLVRKKG